ncbi:hypothetical protein D9M72_642760 [compost metagenome]
MFSSPTRFSAGTSTLSKNTSFRLWRPSMLMMGRTVMPGDFRSIRMKEMPDCGLVAPGSVRTRQKIQSE